MLRVRFAQHSQTWAHEPRELLPPARGTSCRPILLPARAQAKSSDSSCIPSTHAEKVSGRKKDSEKEGRQEGKEEGEKAEFSVPQAYSSFVHASRKYLLAPTMYRAQSQVLGHSEEENQTCSLSLLADSLQEDTVSK